MSLVLLFHSCYKLTRVAQRRLVTAKDLIIITHAGRWSIVTLLILPIERILAAELLESLTAVLLGLFGGI